MALNQGIKSNTRRLTSREIALAYSIFGESIDYKRVRIDDKARIACRQHDLAYVGFEVINSWGALSDPHFIHEMVHVWQYQHFGSCYIPRALWAQRTKAGYNYGGIEGLEAALAAGKRLLDFNWEQQGDIVADYFCLQYGYMPRWCKPNAAYISVFKLILEPLWVRPQHLQA
jgi:hypothetical protein